MDIHAESRQGHWGESGVKNAQGMRFFYFHPYAVTLYFFLMFFLVFLFSNPFFVSACFIYMLFFSFFIDKAQALKTLRFCAVLIFIITIINPLFNRRGATILFYLFDRPFTLESLLIGFQNAVIVASMFLIFFCFNRFVDSAKFLHVFSAALPKTAFVVSMSLRAVDIFKSRAVEISGVQKVKGFGINKAGFKEKVKNAGHLFELLVSSSLEDGMSIALSVKARGYGKKRRTRYNAYRFTYYDAVIIILMIIIFVALVFSSLRGVGLYNFYPRVHIPKVDNADSFVFILLLSFMFIPFISGTVNKVRRVVRDWKTS